MSSLSTNFQLLTKRRLKKARKKEKRKKKGKPTQSCLYMHAKDDFEFLNLRRSVVHFLRKKEILKDSKWDNGPIFKVRNQRGPCFLSIIKRL